MLKHRILASVQSTYKIPSISHYDKSMLFNNLESFCQATNERLNSSSSNRKTAHWLRALSTANAKYPRYQCQRNSSPRDSKHNFHFYDNDAESETQVEIYLHFFILNVAALLPAISLFSTVLSSTDNDLYVGTDADFSGNDPIIYREPLQTDQYDSLSLNGKANGSGPSNTAANDNRHNPHDNNLSFCRSLFFFLSAPNFAGSFTFGDFVYFFFRETAVEFINCGKVCYR